MKNSVINLLNNQYHSIFKDIEIKLEVTSVTDHDIFIDLIVELKSNKREISRFNNYIPLNTLNAKFNSLNIQIIQLRDEILKLKAHMGVIL